MSTLPSLTAQLLFPALICGSLIVIEIIVRSNK